MLQLFIQLLMRNNYREIKASESKLLNYKENTNLNMFSENQLLRFIIRYKQFYDISMHVLRALKC